MFILFLLSCGLEFITRCWQDMGVGDTNVSADRGSEASTVDDGGPALTPDKQQVSCNVVR